MRVPRNAIGLPILCLLFSSAPPACSQLNQEYSSAHELGVSLINESQRAITRDNSISLVLNEIRVSPSDLTPTRYALLIEATLLPDAGGTEKTFSLAYDKPIEVRANSAALAKTAASSRTLFTNVDLAAAKEIEVRIYLVRLDQAEQKVFSDVASLLGSVAQKSMYGPLVKILGLDPSEDPQNTKLLAFQGRFVVPVNYWAHSNIQHLGLASLTNDEPIAIVLEGDLPRANSSLASYLANKANLISQLVSDRNVIKNSDKIEAAAVLTFTKAQLEPLPKSLTKSLERVRHDLDATFLADEASKIIENANNLLLIMEDDLSSAGFASSLTYVDLARIYMKFRQYRLRGVEDASARDSILKDFREWLAQSQGTLHQDPSSGPRIKNVYSLLTTQRYPVIVFPYALTDNLIIATIAWETKLHEFASSSLSSTAPLPVKVEDFTFSATVAPLPMSLNPATAQ